jgi:DNA-binding transcriptional ArsR family regulator/precorrin-6B methylase 2
MSSKAGLDAMVQALKSAAEPTRLRLLALLAHGELQVGELCKVLGQSQPRVSRHLRLLTEAGFLDRFREQQCVYYRTPARVVGFGWLHQLLEQMDDSEPALKRDRERVTQVLAARARAATRALQAAEQAEAAAGPAPELAAVLLEEVGPTNVQELLDVGTGAGGLMQLLARRARHAVGIDVSVPALRIARTRLHSAGLRHCEFHRGDMYELPCEDHSIDLVSMGRMLAAADRPVAALTEAARVLRSGGRLLIVEQIDEWMALGQKQPLQQLRAWLAEAGWQAARVRPCDLPQGHHLIVTARIRVND